MATAIPFIAKAVVGMAVSKIVGKITGNELLGALAGGFIGAGFGIDSVTGAFKFTNPVSGLFNSAGATTTGAANAGVQSAGLGIGDTANLLGEGAAAGSLASDAVVAASNVNPATLALANPAASSLATTGDLAATAAASGGGLLSDAGNLLDKAGNWMEKNPKMAQGIMDFGKGMFTPDKIDEIAATGEQERLTLAEKAKLEKGSKEAVDDKALQGRLQAMNNDLFSAGYQPGMMRVAMSDFNPGYSSTIDPNYQSRVNSVYTLPRDEETV